MSLSRGCELFCNFLAEQYSGSSKMVAFYASDCPVDAKTAKSFYRELQKENYCNPKNPNCIIGETFYFELTDKGSSYLNSKK